MLINPFIDSFQKQLKDDFQIFTPLEILNAHKVKL